MRKAVLEKIVRVSFNGQPLFEVEDSTFASPGNDHKRKVKNDPEQTLDLRTT